MAELNERIFWMDRNQEGLYESGLPLTLDQLHEVFDNRDSFDVDRFLASGNTAEQYEGAFRDDDTFTIKEVGSHEELRDLMTWSKFNPWEDSCAASMDIDFEYPDFVHEDLRKYNYLHSMTGYTRDDLPYGLGDNPTYDKYMEELGIAEGEDEYHYSDEEQAVYDIQHALNGDGDDDDYDEDDEDEYGEGGEFTVDAYNDILQEYGLEKYVLGDDSQEMIDAFADSVDSMPEPDAQSL